MMSVEIAGGGSLLDDKSCLSLLVRRGTNKKDHLQNQSLIPYLIPFLQHISYPMKWFKPNSISFHFILIFLVFCSTES
jgi:hypothetical protein